MMVGYCGLSVQEDQKLGGYGMQGITGMALARNLDWKLRLQSAHIYA
jgi:hypothetical protein